MRTHKQAKQSKTRKANSVSKMKVEALEPRLLLSADGTTELANGVSDAFTVWRKVLFSQV